ncbi:MAG: hypothetical protein A2074_04075 [Candidatus Aquicultor primus]|uniref:HAD family hydrolase n=1 Tax=Candidatus Aquicultor primus TaxID=1797195 RepID=A0A1F2URP5_9ACTN|nr:MAG: hypothetical protein A2074_04075 [Candidatus Aquicultor primus]
MPVLYGPGWELSEISGLIFDKDGTIIDSHLYWGEIVRRRATAVIKHYGLSSANFDEICGFMGYSTELRRLKPAGPVALVARPEVIHSLAMGLTALSVKPETEELETLFGEVMTGFNKDILQYVKLLPGAEKFIARASEAGLKLSLVTSDSAVSAEKILAHTGLKQYFGPVIGRESVSADKKTGLPALAALSGMAVSPERTAAIGDAPVDAEMALRAGLKAAVMVASGQVLKSDLAELSRYVADSFAELDVR